MVITILTAAFLFLVLLIAVVGYKSVIKRGSSPQDINTEKCALCRKRFDKAHLVEREIGDYKLMYFCTECVLRLYADLGMKN